MKRREFLKKLGIGVPAVVIGTKIAIDSIKADEINEPEEVEKIEPIKITTASTAGFYHSIF